MLQLVVGSARDALRDTDVAAASFVNEQDG
jgi:hypothetical protein